jgi:hypothetical protein
MNFSQFYINVLIKQNLSFPLTIMKSKFHNIYEIYEKIPDNFIYLGSVYFNVKWFPENNFHILQYLLRRKIKVKRKMISV